MKNKLPVSLILTAVLLLVSFAPLPADASHSWNNYHWARSSNPVSLEIGNNMSAEWQSHLYTAVGDWNASSVLSLAVAAGQARGRCKATTGRIEVCNDFYGNTGWLGIASISVSGDHITAGTAKMNDTYFSSAPYNTPEWRQMVVCQEIGHDFGLDHQDENFDNANLNTCMDYTSDPSTNQHPNSHDYEQLEILYGHLDADGGGGNGGGGKDCPPRNPNCNGGNGIPDSEFNNPGEWGQLVRSEGRIAIYERDFGNGNRLVTFVIWA